LTAATGITPAVCSILGDISKFLSIPSRTAVFSVVLVFTETITPSSDK